MYLIVHPGTDTFIKLDECLIVEVDDDDYATTEPMTYDPELKQIERRSASAMEMRPPVDWLTTYDRIFRYG